MDGILVKLFTKTLKYCLGQDEGNLLLNPAIGITTATSKSNILIQKKKKTLRKLKN